MKDTEQLKMYIKKLIVASREAGDAILDVYDKDDLSISAKSDNSPLTQADLASNKILCDALKSLAPEIPIISEECDNSDYNIRKEWEYCWIVDPLDGTKEFIKRNGEFTTNVALVHNGKPILGVVYAPVLDEMYYGGAGCGAYLEKMDKTQTISATEYRSSDRNLKLVCSRSHLNEATQSFVDEYDHPELVASGSSLKFLKIASGNAHIYPRLAPTMEWDTAAADAILTAAGGEVLDADTMKPLHYNKENLLNPHFVARAKLV